MAVDVDSLVLEQLRHIRKAVDETRVDMIDIMASVSGIERKLGHIMSQLAVTNGMPRGAST